ncbi:MAG: hypothetical protein JHC33_12050 [Ignisphaera sp.]|nr:hypothetical protein [Ignisphaera sp.]
MELQVDPADGELKIIFTLQPDIIASTITFDNSEKVAYGLYHSNLEAAIALHAELDYHIKGSTC